MAENIKKVFPHNAWYDDIDLDRYKRVMNILGEYKKGNLDKDDVRWFIKCAIINNIYISENVHKNGNSAWRTPSNPRLQDILSKLYKDGHVTHKEIDIEKFRAKGVCFEHVVPYNVVFEVLLQKFDAGALTFDEFQWIRSKNHVCLVTKAENKVLNVFRQTMPPNTDWLNTPGDEFARYRKTGVRIYRLSLNYKNINNLKP